MGLGNLYLLLLVAVSSFTAPRTAADDFLAPIISPIINATCENVECGKGTCSFSPNNTFGIVCNCNPGWSQFRIDDKLRFLPCVIPNCSVNYSCNKDSEPPAPPPPPPPSNLSFFDPCRWSFCGKGSCVKTSTFEYRCECGAGYRNLLNISSSPCFQECALGADCAKLGIPMTNSSSSCPSPSNSPTSSQYPSNSPSSSQSPSNNLPDNSTSSSSTLSPKQLLGLFISAIYLVIARTT